MAGSASKRLSVLVPRAATAPKRRASLAPLVGREDDLARVLAALEAGARVVTLTGPPGIGKTRLALACLERAGGDVGAAWFADLSQARTERDLSFAVLTLLRGRFEGEHVEGDEASSRVAEALAEAGPTLLVLDNFEQIVTAAGTVERWCEQLPELAVLVTSRERLAIAGEVVVELSPLACPDAHADLGAALASPAVQLFLKRARDAGGAVKEDARALASIVRRLEGIPLALELAAARTRLLSVAELEARLSLGQPVLSRSARGADGRHATLANAIEWSWSLLSPREQTALARCSVLAGSFSVELAERVIATPDAVELLAALRDKSLVHVEGEGRLALYVSIRDYARGRLGDLGRGALEDAQVALAQALGDLSRRFNRWRHMQDRVPREALHAELRPEKENLLEAVAIACDMPPTREATKLRAELVVSAALLHALPGEACIDELTAALSACGALGEAAHETVAMLLLTRQSVYASLGQYELSLSDLEAVLSLTDLPDSLSILALVYRGIQLRYSGAARGAWESHVRAREALAAADLPRLRAMNEACMGRLSFDLGDLEASREYNGRAIAFADSVGDSWLGALALANLAQLEQEEQRFDRAQDLLSSALERLRHVGEMYEAIYSAACGDLYYEQGKYDDARRWYEQGARFFRTFLTHRHAAIGYASWAALEARDGDRPRAHELMAVAKRSAEKAKNSVIDVCVTLHDAAVSLLSSEGGERDRLVREWRARMPRYEDPGDPEGAIVATSFDARFALRMAKRALAEGAPPASTRAPSTLRIDKSGRWFEVTGRPRVDLGRRGALRRILLALAEKRVSGQDHGLKQADLAAAGWPGERVLVDAAATRVRVAVATLRQLGLRSILVTRDDGYVLDASARVELSFD